MADSRANRFLKRPLAANIATAPAPHISGRNRRGSSAEEDGARVDPDRESSSSFSVSRRQHLHGLPSNWRCARSQAREDLPGFSSWKSTRRHPFDPDGPASPGSPPAADHVEHYYSMTLSKCYRASAGRMRCITCHDPHVEPSSEEAPAYFAGNNVSAAIRTKAVSCPLQRECSESRPMTA